ncbi:sensor histidine kinase [Stomatohabitans albus]|uniref:sensor histidine kinase n=1 Tax=Stomatohabitans albus TaxID=3110766 RepID=UPI00300D9D30
MAERQTVSTTSGEAQDHLTRLTREWQVLSDLAFADLLLLVPAIQDGQVGWTCIAQNRPHTAQTVHVHDQIGLFREEPYPAPVTPADLAPFARDQSVVLRRVIPVRFQGQIIAIILMERFARVQIHPSLLEDAYAMAVRALEDMIAEGTFPFAEGDLPSAHVTNPRVGDGVILLDSTGQVIYASPNAVSAYRRLAPSTPLIDRPFSAIDPGYHTVKQAVESRLPVRGEISQNGRMILRRIVPFLQATEITGAMVLIRDVTEMRRHQAELHVRDVTISEIHHRVKNNLQTVASLLRLQIRRTQSEEVKDALVESVRRISSIAYVHEFLSGTSGDTVQFDDIANHIVTMLGQGLVGKHQEIRLYTTGEPGLLNAQQATPLALILSELIQNGIEHAFPNGQAGEVRVSFDRYQDRLVMQVSDTGVGLSNSEPLSTHANLGLQICESLAVTELGGSLHYTPGQPGAIFTVDMPLAAIGEPSSIGGQFPSPKNHA